MPKLGTCMYDQLVWLLFSFLYSSTAQFDSNCNHVYWLSRCLSYWTSSCTPNFQYPPSLGVYLPKHSKSELCDQPYLLHSPINHADVDSKLSPSRQPNARWIYISDLFESEPTTSTVCYHYHQKRESRNQVTTSNHTPLTCVRSVSINTKMDF